MPDQPKENIFLFVPNLIGYGRIILALVAFYYMPYNPIIGSICYIISGMLDAVDGYAARALNQSSRVGAMLDQLTDRVGTCGLLMVLCMLYPRWAILFQISTALDITSHWIHFYSSTSLLKSTSHKTVDYGSSILKLYYTSRPLLFFMCLGNETCYTMLYLCYFTPGPYLLPFLEIGLFDLLFFVSLPVAIAKAFCSWLQLKGAMSAIADVDVEERKQLKKKE
ncbi:CDIPT [Branchiostoma lanceolatum]|uniref:CDP-diacylglycerol--inositol 3-phosphatidyltransferase n=1 Tax=Branchiostoma lanceolatum TaxID=7740 RepID=A0A8J9VLI9_BRALA|nr:CDIPT [Branchiostoma lanceolatum]